MRTLLVSALIAWLAVTGAYAAPASSHVRALTPGMTDVLSAAVDRSPFVRSCVAALETSDVIVYLTDLASPTDGGPKAYLRFVSVTDYSRFVLVSVNRWAAGPSESIALLGHELQHAVELATDPEVRDESSFGMFYRRIGWELGRGHFETDAARVATSTVRMEVAGWGRHAEYRPEP